MAAKIWSTVHAKEDRQFYIEVFQKGYEGTEDKVYRYEVDASCDFEILDGCVCFKPTGQDGEEDSWMMVPLHNVELIESFPIKS